MLQPRKPRKANAISSMKNTGVWGDLDSGVNYLPKSFEPKPVKDVRKEGEVLSFPSLTNTWDTLKVRTSKGDNDVLKRTLPIEEAAAKEFKAWYSDPATKQKFKNNTGLDPARLQDFVGRALRTPTVQASTSEQFDKLNAGGAVALYETAGVKKNNYETKNVNTGDILYDKDNGYDPYKSKEETVRGTQSLLGHEFGHASGIDNKLGPALMNVLGNTNTQKTKSATSKIKGYLNRPQEAYGNFHEFRLNLGLKPGQEVDEEQLKQLVKEKKQESSNFYNTFDDDKIVKAINTIASTGTNDVTYAKYGGSINPNTNNKMMLAKTNKKIKVPKMDMGGVLPDVMSGVQAGAGGGDSVFSGALSGAMGGVSAGPIGMGVGAVTGIITSELQRKAQEKQQQQMFNQQYKEQQIEDKVALDTYKDATNLSVDYYAEGGQLPNPNSNTQTIGGQLKTLDNETQEVDGNTHDSKTIDGQYGVTLHDDNGQPFANVEDDEIIKDGNYVYSDRLKTSTGTTFAKAIKTLTNKKIKVEKRLEGTRSSKSIDGYKRQLDGFEILENNLMLEQEMKRLAKQPKNKGVQLPMYAKGGKLTADASVEVDAKGNSIWTDLAPKLMDNVGNLAMSLNSPKLPTPIPYTAEALETNYNINPQLAEVKNAVSSATDNINYNTSNSNVARANIASTKLRGAEASGKLYGEKGNIETGLRNQNAMNKQRINNVNTQANNQFQDSQFTRQTDIAGQISANLGEVSENIVQSQRDVAQRDSWDEQTLLDMLDDNTGAKGRTIDDNPYYARNPKLNKAIKAAAARRKANTKN